MLLLFLLTIDDTEGLRDIDGLAVFDTLTIGLRDALGELDTAPGVPDPKSAVLEGKREASAEPLMIDDLEALRLARIDTDAEKVLICFLEGAFDEDTVNVDKAKLNVGTALLLTVAVAYVLALEDSDALPLVDRDGDMVGSGELVPSFTLVVPVVDVVIIAVFVAESLPEVNAVAVMVFTFVAYVVSVTRTTVGDADILDVNEESAETLESELTELENDGNAETVITEALAVEEETAL